MHVAREVHGPYLSRFLRGSHENVTRLKAFPSEIKEPSQMVPIKPAVKEKKPSFNIGT